MSVGTPHSDLIVFGLYVQCLHVYGRVWVRVSVFEYLLYADSFILAIANWIANVCALHSVQYVSNCIKAIMIGRKKIMVSKIQPKRGRRGNCISKWTPIFFCLPFYEHRQSTRRSKEMAMNTKSLAQTLTSSLYLSHFQKFFQSLKLFITFGFDSLSPIGIQCNKNWSNEYEFHE